MNVRSETIKLVEENKLICSLTLALTIYFWIYLFRLVNKGLVKAMVSPVVMYVVESWAIKKAEH